MERILGPEILCYLSWQRTFIILKELALSGTSRKTAVTDYGICASMVHRADYHLLGLPHLIRLSPVQNAVRLALLIVDVAGFVGLPPNALFVKCMALQLKEAMEEVDVWKVEPCEDEIIRLRVWILFIGVVLSSASKERRWFIPGIVEGSDALSLNSCDELEQLLVQFLCPGSGFTKEIDGIWEEIAKLKS